MKLPISRLLLGLSMALTVVAALAICSGAVPISLSQLGSVLLHGSQGAPPELDGIAAIVWQIRLPRVLLGALAGAGLAVAGVAWQGALRNPLADPYLIGASAGGALGAGIAILFGLGTGTSFALPLMAFLGALLAVAVVYRMAIVPGRGLSIERMLLAGVAVSSMLSAVLSLAAWARSESFQQLYFWLVGGLSGRGWEHLQLVMPYVALSALGLLYFAPRLNLLQMGEETAHSLGVDVRSDRRWIIVLAALLTAAIVSVCGMIGFLGLVIPHVARLLVGPDLRRVLPTAALLGAMLLVLADWAARTLWAPVEVPVGILTAMMGAPFFLYLLSRQRP